VRYSIEVFLHEKWDHCAKHFPGDSFHVKGFFLSFKWYLQLVMYNTWIHPVYIHNIINDVVTPDKDGFGWKKVLQNVETVPFKF